MQQSWAECALMRNRDREPVCMLRTNVEMVLMISTVTLKYAHSQLAQTTTLTLMLLVANFAITK